MLIYFYLKYIMSLMGVVLFYFIMLNLCLAEANVTKLIYQTLIYKFLFFFLLCCADVVHIDTYLITLVVHVVFTCLIKAQIVHIHTVNE